MSTQAPVRPLAILRLWRRLRALDRPAQLALVLVMWFAMAVPAVVAYLRITAWPVRLELRSRSAFMDGLAFSPDGKTLATENGGITIRDTESGKIRRHWAAPDGFRARKGAFAPDGKVLAVAGQIGPHFSGMPNPNPLTIRLLDIQSGQMVGSLATTDEWIENLAFSADGRTIRAVMHTMGTAWKVVTWDARHGDVITTQPLAAPRLDHVSLISTSHDGQTLAMASMEEPDIIVLWDMALGRRRCVLASDVASNADCTIVIFSGDDTTLAVGRDDGSVEVWDLSTLKRRKTLRGHTGDFVSGYLIFSPDGRTLASEAHTGPLAGLRLVRARVQSFMRRPLTGLAELVVWDIPSGRRLATVEDEGELLISPDGRTLISRPVYESGVLRSRSIPKVFR